MSTTTDLPRWRLDTIFPDLDSDAFISARDALERDIDAFEALLDEAGIGRSAAQAEAQPESAAAPEQLGATVEALLGRLDRLLVAYADIRAYLVGIVSTDAFHDAAQSEQSRLLPLGSRLSLAMKRIAAWIGHQDLEALLEHSAAAREHAYLLERFAVVAQHLMPDEAEAVAAALEPTGGSAWARLHGNLIARSTIRANLPGRPPREYGIAELKNLQRDPDPAVREAAWRSELELLAGNEVAYAAALNSIKGQVFELSLRRGWRHPLEATIFDSAITEAALDAMQQACAEHFPVLRSYLQAKARLLGKPALAWFDLLAPVPSATREFVWDEARAFIIAAFATYSPQLAAFAERAFDAGWLDAPPHKGKRNGAFCMSVPGRKESRVLLNFGGSLDDIFTIAHELGHAYHNDCMYRAGRTALQRSTPMTLAETASIFCETIVVNAMLERADANERLAILEQDLLGATQLVLDIHSRFLFEKAVFDKRRERELSVAELKGIMLDAQASTYGEALESGARHPYMWANKSHYYSTRLSFYNFPYTFGFLFGLGLYRIYQQEPAAFRARYDDLLASTGMRDANSLARDFGIDLEAPEFWRESLAIIAERAASFVELAEAAS